MLRSTVHRCFQRSAESTATDLQTSWANLRVSRREHREICGMGFNGRAAAHPSDEVVPPLDSKAEETCSLECRLTLLYLATRWMSPGLTVVRRTLLDWLRCTTSSLVERGVMVWGRFTGLELGHLIPVKRTLNASASKDIWDHFILPTLWEQFGDDPFLFQHACAPVHKERPNKMTEWVWRGGAWLAWPESRPQPDRTPLE